MDYVIYIDAKGNTTMKRADPRFKEIDETWASHQPETIRGSASVCRQCKEAWPCTKWEWAEAKTYELLKEGEPNASGPFG